MRARGLAGRATGAVGATATDSVAACICVGLRRRYTIPSCFQTGPRRSVVYILAPIARVSDQFSDRRSANRQHYGNHENVNKSKGPNKGSGL
ncbi:hypothetical protein GCM10007858_59120 [Bradyrhizobium liaoningense]|nr:hypothetical protein GCM10007858_59120 [Bradyrhizobium liaoningense]